MEMTRYGYRESKKSALPHYLSNGVLMVDFLEFQPAVSEGSVTMKSIVMVGQG